MAAAAAKTGISISNAFISLQQAIYTVSLSHIEF